MKYVINVLQEDIDNGSTQSPTRCPVARAIRRTLPKSDAVVGSREADLTVTKTTFFFFKRDVRKFCVKLPSKAKSFIINYDAYGKKDTHVKPFNFELEV